MLALSTSWQLDGSTTAERMFETFTHLGIKGVELSYQTSENQYQQLKQLLKPSGLKVVSIHNFFPIPPVKSVKKDSKGGGDLFLLSSQDDEERQRAIRYTTKTIEHAAEMDAAAVVLHSLFNHFILSPMLSTLLIMVTLPLLIVVVFSRSEKATRNWLGEGWNADVELLESITPTSLLHGQIIFVIKILDLGSDFHFHFRGVK